MALTRSCKMAICLATRQPMGRYSWVCVCEEREGERDAAIESKRDKKRGGGWIDRAADERSE